MNKHTTPEAKHAARNQILVAEVGSTVQGCGVGDQDDLDLMGICIEPPEYVVGLRSFEQWISRTKADGTQQEEGARSGPGDTDLVVFSLRKWVSLALKGNPSVMLPLFVPDDKVHHITGVGRELRGMARHFASRAAGRAYLGYMTQQREKLTGERGGRHVNRPELVEKYGFDTKYAYHLLRLGMQGVEFLETCFVTVPIPEAKRSWLVGVRTGEVPLETILDAARGLESQVKGLLVTSPLPEQADPLHAERWMVRVYREAWGWGPTYRDAWGLGTLT